LKRNSVAVLISGGIARGWFCVVM